MKYDLMLEIEESVNSEEITRENFLQISKILRGLEMYPKNMKIEHNISKDYSDESYTIIKPIYIYGNEGTLVVWLNTDTSFELIIDQTSGLYIAHGSNDSYKYAYYDKLSRCTVLNTYNDYKEELEEEGFSLYPGFMDTANHFGVLPDIELSNSDIHDDNVIDAINKKLEKAKKLKKQKTKKKQKK